jgi:MoaA/NifB/PqqE/SkfB family radical SAM enzyme
MTDFRCAAPWRGLHINPRGDVKTCCAGDPNMLGNLNDRSIQEILFSPLMQEIRQTLRRGEPHAYCYNCVQAERYGRSERDWHNSVSPEFDSSTAGDLEHRPTLIDVRWNITCNLSCNYCGDKCSSRWAALKHIPFRSGARPYYEQVCDYLDSHREHIREVALVGGEPLLLPENERLLDVIPPDCVVTLITNLSVDLTRNRIFEKLQQRNRVGWSLSFDNVGERFEYVRHGASWDLLLHNLDLVQALMQERGHWGGIHAVYNLYSATHLCELRDYADSVGVSILWQTLYQPQYLDPAMLGSRVRDLCAQELSRFRDRFELTDVERSFFDNVEQRLDTPAVVDHTNTRNLRQHIIDIETKYHTQDIGKFSELWPEYAFLTKENQ